MPKKKTESVYRTYEEIVSDLPDGTVYPCIDDPNYGKQTKHGKIMGCVKGDGYWVGGTAINREEIELITDREIIPVSQIPPLERDLISPDLETIESRLDDIEDIQLDEETIAMIKKSGKTPSKYQKAIYWEVKHGTGNVVIEARAGSGKTTTIVNALKLIPRNKRVLVSAFSVKIAAELRARCPPNVDVMTLHGFGLRQLLKYFKEKGQIETDDYVETDENYTIKDKKKDINIDAHGYYVEKFIKNKIHPYLKPGIKQSSINKLEDYIKDCLNLAQAYAMRPEDEGFVERIREAIAVRIIKDEKEQVALQRALDFTTIKEDMFTEEAQEAGFQYSVVDFAVIMMILLLRYVLKTNKEGKKQIWKDGEWQDVVANEAFYSFNDMIYITAISDKINVDQYDYVFIDEAQDMNIAQITMLLKAGQNGRIFVIGDPRQAIFLFQYSELDMMTRMKKLLNAKTLKLSVSYRVPKSVGNVARKCVKDFEVPDSAIEGEVHNITSDEMLKLLKPGDIVISRKNVSLKKAANKIIVKGHPIIVLGLDNYDKILEKTIKEASYGLPKNAGVRAVINDRIEKITRQLDDIDDALIAKSAGRKEDLLLKLGAKRSDFFDNNRKPLGFGALNSMLYIKQRIAKDTLEKITFISELSDALGTDIPSEIIEKAKELIGEFPKIDHAELRKAGAEAGRLIAGFERRKARAMEQYVLLTTVHKFKGSEADRIFVLEDTFSSKCESPPTEEGSEEDNLYYVAVTRAKEHLFLVSGDFSSKDEDEQQ